jgi:hypothetical protein
MTIPTAIAPAAATSASATAPIALPWVQDVTEPPAIAAPAAPSRPAMREGRRSSPAFAPMHWSVIALTLATALSIVLGSYGGEQSQSRELLPIVMTAYR